MATVLIRTLIVYILFVLAIRMTGKRQVGELQISELVITFMISELATAPIQDISIPIFYSIIPIIFLLCFEVIVSFVLTKSSKLKKIFTDSPSFLIKNGVLNQKELGRLRIGLDELLSQLRQKDVSNISDVDYAILEQNGKLSVFLKKDEQNVCVKDLGINVKSNGIGHAVVIDGCINKSNLLLASKNERWLKRELGKRGLDTGDVFLMMVDDSSNIDIIIKEKK